jgi:hypothetical protein
MAAAELRLRLILREECGCSAWNQREFFQIFSDNRRDRAGDTWSGDDCLQYACVTAVVGWEESSQIRSPDWARSYAPLRNGRRLMQWEYKLVALGLLVDATEPHQREKHEQILNELGREGRTIPFF